jgi:hypothetical protein
MLNIRPAFAMLALAVGGASAPVQAFRDCGVEDSGAWTALSRYVVGELGYDDATGAASGTETHYNYSNLTSAGAECHVTYELDGVFEPFNRALVLEARRSNLSPDCDPEFVDAEYPEYLSYYLELALAEDGRAEIRHSDTGAVFASGDWGHGALAYKTEEQCFLM